MRRPWLLLPLLTIGCAGPEDPIGEHASWIYSETEFTAYRFDEWDRFPDLPLSTGQIGPHPKGSRIALQRTFDGAQAAEILQSIARSEVKLPRDRYRNDATNVRGVVFRFLDGDKIADLAVNSNGSNVVLYIDGEPITPVYNISMRGGLSHRVEPIFNPFLNGRYGLGLSYVRESRSFKLTLSLQNFSLEDVEAPPFDLSRVRVQMRDFNERIVFERRPTSSAPVPLSAFRPFKVGASESVKLTVTGDEIRAEPFDCRAGLLVKVDGAEPIELWSDWVELKN